MVAMRLLIVEDDERLREILVGALRSRAFAVDAAGTMAEARELLFDNANVYDGTVLDLKLPDGTSLELLEEFAAAGNPLNAAILSAYGTPEDRVAALKAGAVDFISKPIRMKELALRVQHLVSRRPVEPIAAPIRLGNVTLDRARQVVFIGDDEVTLTPTPFRVFRYLMVHRDRLVPTQELIDHCWDRRTDLFSNPVHSQISRLRNTFEGELSFIHDHGGYRLGVVGEQHRPNRR